MRLGFFFITVFVSSAFGQTSQQKTDHAVLAAYDEGLRPGVKAVSVEKGFLLASGGFWQFGRTSDEKLAPPAAVEPGPSKSALQNIKDMFETFGLLKKKANEPVTREKIEKEKDATAANARVGRELKDILALRRNGTPSKVTANDVCAPSGARLQVYYKQQNFTLSQTDLSASKKRKNSVEPDEAPVHTTRLQYLTTAAEETESYNQYGSNQMGLYSTQNYKLVNKDRVTTLPKEKQFSEELLKAFVAQSIKAAPMQALGPADETILNEELLKSWSLLKRVSACCSQQACRQAMVSVQSVAPDAGLAPAVR